MEYLIIIYEGTERVETFVLNEKEMYDYVEKNHDDVKFTVSRVECIMDFS